MKKIIFILSLALICPTTFSASCMQLFLDKPLAPADISQQIFNNA